MTKRRLRQLNDELRRRLNAIMPSSCRRGVHGPWEVLDEWVDSEYSSPTSPIETWTVRLVQCRGCAIRREDNNRVLGFKYEKETKGRGER